MQAKPNQQQKSVVIFGAGISGITLARLFAEQNYQVTIYEKNNFIGGNCHDYYNEHKILVHQFGPHIFHTSNQRVYRFIRRFTKLNKFVNRVLIPLNKHVYFPLPINFDSIKIIMREKADGIIAVLKATFKKQKTITLFDLKKIKDADVQKFAK
jgi:UDP-galactopyranose mutase